MVNFPERRRALTDAAFATFGEDAAWEGSYGALATAVRVRFGGRDEERSFGQVQLTDRRVVVRVRSWEVATPMVGDTVVGTTASGTMRYEISDDPLIDNKGVWTCPVKVVA